MKVRGNLWAVAFLMGAISGCAVIRTQVRDLRDEFSIKAQNRCLAYQAWGRVTDVYCDVPCLTDFKCGFIAGFCDLAGGGRGCPPPLPPRRYWQAKYRGAVGTERAQAWFDGFRHGVLIAEQDGLANLSRIPTSVPVAPPPATGSYWPTTTPPPVGNEVFVPGPVPTEGEPAPEPAPAAVEPEVENLKSTSRSQK